MKGKTNAVVGSRGDVTSVEKINISLTSNQSSAADLLGATITLEYGEYTKVVTWEGRYITMVIPSYVDYIIKFGDVEGYATPSMLELNAAPDNIRQIEALYQTEVITVAVSADNGAPVSGQNITINGVTMTLDNSGVVSHRIPYGTSYTVSVNGKYDYNLPVVQNFIASQPLRSISMIYEKLKLGVFIQDSTGRLWTESEWDSVGYTNDQSNGVAVVSDSTRFVIAKVDTKDSRLAWGGYNKIITGVVSTTTMSEAVLDFDGAGNTAKILEQCAGYVAQDITGAPASESCAAYVFTNGKNGYMGSLGQWQVAYNNMLSVNRIMTKIGGSAIQSGYYWASTQGSEVYAWCINWSSNVSTIATKNATHYVRAFTDL